jgi:DNA primase
MSPFIKDASVQAVLSAASIVDVISGYTSLRKRGATYSGLCPFHQEKTPSFTVSSDKGLYYCFGCGEGGDVVRFVERVENLSFAEAIEQLGERFGVPVEYEDGAGPDPERRDRETRLLLACEKAATFYQRFLWESAPGKVAQEYLEKRGLGREICQAFRVGYSPAQWRGLHARAVKEGFTDRELEEAGLLVRQTGKTYDRFRGRLMFPLVDHRGRVLGFGGRTLTDETPKYLNSPEGPLYQKGHLLYGLYQARKAIADADEVIVVEGYTDVLAMVQAGAANVVASMGTALTDAQINLMMRFTSNVTFMFDADRAGTEAMLRSGELARGHGLRPMTAVLPTGSDPADVAVGGGKDAIGKVLTGKTSLLVFEVRQLIARGDPDSTEGRAQLISPLRPVVDRAMPGPERNELIEYVADRLHLDAKYAAQLFSGTAPIRRLPTSSRSATAQTRVGEMLLAVDLERDFLVAAACNPQYAVPLLGSLTPEHFSDAGNREVFVSLRDAFAVLTESDDPAGALAGLRLRTHADPAAGSLFVRMVIEADQGRYSPALLEEFNWRLQEQYLLREVGVLRGSLEDGGNVIEKQRRLFSYERLLQSVRTNLTNLDPEEGGA